MGTQEYDVIVVGASFAGLAVARQLRGQVLLLDRHEHRDQVAVDRAGRP